MRQRNRHVGRQTEGSRAMRAKKGGEVREGQMGRETCPMEREKEN